MTNKSMLTTSSQYSYFVKVEMHKFYIAESDVSSKRFVAQLGEYDIRNQRTIN